MGSAVHIQTCNKVCHWIRSRLERLWTVHDVVLTNEHQKNTIQISDKYVYMLKTVLFTFTSCTPDIGLCYSHFLLFVDDVSSVLAYVSDIGTYTSTACEFWFTTKIKLHCAMGTEFRRRSRTTLYVRSSGLACLVEHNTDTLAGI